MRYLAPLVLAIACAEPPPPPPAEEAELPWELDGELDSEQPACPADQPDCDRIDDTDTPDDDLGLDVPDDGDDDLALGYDDALADAGPRRALADPKTAAGRFRVWPHGRIPYRFATFSNGAYQLDAATRTRVSQAMTNWERLTEGRIKFRKRLATDKAYVIIRRGSPLVRPFVGYRSGKVQELYLRQGEPITVMKHELGHVVGLHHEQRRTDRLSFIKVVSRNIVATDLCRYQFATCSDCTKVGSYNTSSVMHYRTSDLGNCRKGSVLLHKNGTAIQHVWKLTARDLDAVERMYRVPTAPPPPTPTPGPHPIPVFAPEPGSLELAGLCFDAASSSVAGCSGAGSQDFRLTTGGQLRVRDTLTCTAVSGDGRLEQAPCTDDDAQRWLLDDMELVHADTASCADGAGIAPCGTPRVRYDAEREAIATSTGCLTADGDAVGVRPCDGSPAQRWLQARGGFVPRANTGRCLALGTGALAVADCSDDPAQRWALRGPLRDARGRCLTAGGLAPCDGSPAQRWTFWSR